MILVGRFVMVKMPTYYEYLLMSQYAYLEKSSTAVSEAALAYLRSQGWCIKEHPDGEFDSGYVGCLYYHDDRKQIVVAHAGTQPSRVATLFADFNGVVYGRPDPLVLDALLLSDDVTQFVQERKFHLSFTGHSLGGFLAEMSVYACHRGFKFRYTNASAVTFDSPGALEVMEVWESHNPSNKISLKNLNIIGFRFSINLVNTLHSPTGTVFRLIRDIGDRSGIFNFSTYLSEAHSLDGVVSLFDPQTGVPREGTYCEMEDWPLADYEEVFSLKDNPIFGTLSLTIKQTLGFIWSIGDTIKLKLTGSVKKKPLVAIFGGREIKLIEALLSPVQKYHPRFDTSTTELGDAVSTHYVIKRREAPMKLSQVLRKIHFIPEVVSFLEIYAQRREQTLYKSFLEEKCPEIPLLPAYRIEGDEIYVEPENDIFELRDRLYEIVESLGRHKEALETYCTDKLSTLEKTAKEHEGQLSDLAEDIRNARNRIDRYKKENDIDGVKRTEERIDRLMDEQDEIKKKFEELQVVLEKARTPGLGPIDIVFSAAALVPDSTVEAHNTGLTSERVVKTIREIPAPAGQGSVRVLFSAFSMAPRTNVKVINDFTAEGSAERQSVARDDDPVASQGATLKK